MKQIITLLTFVLCIAISSTYAQSGSIDNTFNPTDVGFGLGDGANGTVYAIVRQPDGKILIGGEFTTYHGTPRKRIARLNADGSLDTSFDPGNGPGSTVVSIALQPNGKILIAGAFTTYNGTTRNRIARLHPDGSLDTSFNPGIINGGINVIALLPDEKVLIGGDFTAYNSSVRNRIARLNADGTLDTNFDPGGGADGSVRAVALQPDGKILIGGDFNSYNGTPRARITRINADGTLDTGFTPGAGASWSIWSMALQPDGNVLIGGQFTNYDGTTRNSIARLTTTGSVDTSFDPGTGVSGSIYTLYAIAIQEDGKVLIGGHFDTYNGTSRSYLARLNPDGQLDTSFNSGTGANSPVRAIALQPDGKVLIGGALTRYNGTPRNRLARLNADSSLDTSFGTGTGANALIRSMALQPDGKILIGGDFNSYNGSTRNGIARLNADGSIDTSFDPGTALGGLTNPMLHTIALQPNGKILIGGEFTLYNDVPRNRIARLNADGSLDTSFDPGIGSNGSISIIALQADGKILIGGNFSTYDGTSRNRIARLNVNGSLDTSFDPGTGANSAVHALAIQPDGRILIGGYFTSYNGTTRNRIAQLDPDGTLSTGFYTGTGNGPNGQINSIAVQPDGMVVVGGQFTSYNTGTSRNRIARLTENGALDTSFDPGSGLNAGSSVMSIAFQSDGRILIAGVFDSYNGTPCNSIARINSDGTLDTSFNPGTGPGNTVYKAILLPDGKVLIAGSFVSYDGTGRNRIARILGKQDQTISFEALNAKTYGNAAFALGATATSGLDVTYTSSNEDVATVSGSTVTIVGAGQTTITASQGGSAAYNAAPSVQQTLTVNKAPLTASADNKSKTYGDENPALTISYSGFVNGDDATDITKPTVSTTATASSSAGEYDITLSGGSAANYTLTLQKGTLTINKASQAITFPSLETRSTDDASLVLEAVSSSGLEISYSSSNTAVATVSGNTVTILAAGTTDITASQPGNGNYEAAEAVVRTLTVTQAPAEQSISFTTIPDKTIGDPTFPLEATATSGLPVTFTSASGKISISGSSVTLLHPGQVTIAANQAGNAFFKAAPEVLQTFCINPAKPGITVTPGSHELTSTSDTGNQWYLNGELIPGATQSTLLARETGTYTVSVTVDGCTSEASDPYLNTIMSLPEPLAGLKLYPVPASENIRLELRTSHVETVVSICNLHGRVIKEIRTPGKELDITIREYAAGTYILKVQQAGTTWYTRFIKE